MSINVKIPSIGESITEVTLTTWVKEDGDYVEEGDVLCEIESEKATIEVPAEVSGVLSISAEEGAELEIDTVIGSIEPGEAPEGGAEADEAPAEDAPASTTAPAGSGDKNYPSPAARKILDEKGINPETIVFAEYQMALRVRSGVIPICVPGMAVRNLLLFCPR